jgi:hypothetical protein
MLNSQNSDLNTHSGSDEEVQGYSYFSPTVKTAGQMACWGFAGLGAAASGPVGAAAFGAAAQFCSAQWE